MRATLTTQAQWVDAVSEFIWDQVAPDDFREPGETGIRARRRPRMRQPAGEQAARQPWVPVWLDYYDSDEAPAQAPATHPARVNAA
jgi:hypothetical protein